VPNQPASRDFTFSVRVDQPSGDCNRYAFDPNAHAERLVEVLHVAERRPADLGTIPNTLTPDGEPVLVILLVTVPNQPGAQVEARPIALLAWDGVESPRVVAVPIVDAVFATVLNHADLPRERHAAITAICPWRDPFWQPPDAAIAFIRAARERAASKARVEEEKGRRLDAAWQADALARSGRPSDAFSNAEHELRALPYRFQRYVAECLVPSERILLFVTRPPIRPKLQASLTFWKQSRESDGILILTDRQILWLEDALPPDATMVHWGYIAQSGAIERVRAIAVDPGEGASHLAVTFDSSRGDQRVRIVFPSDRHALLQDLVKFVSRWISGTSTRAIRRVYTPEIDPLGNGSARKDKSVDSDAFGDVRGQLTKCIESRLRPSERILASALALSTSERPKSLLVAVTGYRVLLAEDRGQAYREYRIDALTSVTLRRSLVGCLLALAHPDDASVDAIRIIFDYPESDQFLSVFSVVRQLLGQPTARLLHDNPPAPESGRFGYG